MIEKLPGFTNPHIENLIERLDSLIDGDRAVSELVAYGEGAVPYLEHFLLSGSPRTIALPRCRVVRALGELGAYSILLAYFREYERPADPQVLFAEDAVRSAVARELLNWKSDEVYQVLLEAARERATSGLVLALGEFRKPESVPLLFAVLDDDLCREEGIEGLRKVPVIAREYAVLSVRGKTQTDLLALGALRRRRATFQLLVEFGIIPEEWADLRSFLQESDSAVVIAVARLGLQVGPESDYHEIIGALLRVSAHINWLQEDEISRLLDAHRDLASQLAREIAEERQRRGERPNWLMPSWRILRHLLGRNLGSHASGAA